MKIFISIAIIVALVAGFFIGKFWSAEAPTTSASVERQVLYYKAPMDPNYRRDEPGLSPMGMELVPVYADEGSGQEAGVVKISPTVVNNLGVRTAPVQQGPLSREIQTVGYIGYNEDTLHTISTRVDGWIELLAVTATGDPVSKGQTLLELYSPTLVNAQQEYLAALQSNNSLLHKASRERLAALGIGKSEIDRLKRERTTAQRIRIQAPESGVVAHLSVREGEYVTVATDIMSIGSLDDVWLHTEVFERQAAWVAAGQAAYIELESLPGRILEGQVDYVYPELDPKTRTMTARIRLDNSSGELNPNMFARATILVGDSPSALHIPLEALIRGGSVNRVVIVTDDGYRSQPVTLGIESRDRIEVTSGLTANDEVVISGQFLIDSESNISSALARLSTQPDTTPEPMASNVVMVNASVMEIDSDKQQITLAHSAIPEWSMSAMTMTFDVASDIDLSLVQEGDTAEVHLERHGATHIMVMQIRIDSGRDAEAASMPMGNDHSGQEMMDDNASSVDPHAGHNMTPETDVDLHEGHRP